jgi:hypothetical protein
VRSNVAYALVRLTLAALPVLGGVYLLYTALDDASRSRAAAAWPLAPGKVLQHQRLGWIGYGGLVFRYAYAVNGVPYESSRYSFGPFLFTDEADVRAGASVNVHYDPSDHAEAVIRSGLNVGHALPAALGVALLLVGAQIWKRTA